MRCWRLRRLEVSGALHRRDTGTRAGRESEGRAGGWHRGPGGTGDHGSIKVPDRGSRNVGARAGTLRERVWEMYCSESEGSSLSHSGGMFGGEAIARRGGRFSEKGKFGDLWALS